MKRNTGISSLLFALVAALLYVSCNKEQENPLPTAAITAPLAGTTYVAGDTITVIADLADDETLKSARLVLNDKEGRPVLAPIEVGISSNPYHLALSYPISDLSLATGTYELQLTVSNGKSSSNTFRSIQIFSLPVEFLYPIVITQPSANLTYAYMFGQQDDSLILSRNGDFLGAALNPARKQLYISGISQSGLEAWSLQENKLLWNIPAKLLPHNHWFEHLQSDPPYILSSQYEGEIKAYDAGGGTLFSSQSVPAFYPVFSKIQGTYLLANLREYSAERYAIAWYYVPGGTLRQLISPTPRMLAIFPLNQSQSLCFGNQSGKGTIQKLDISAGTLTDLHDFGGERIIQAATMDSDNYLLAGEHHIYWYRYSQNSLVEFVKNTAVSCLECETVNRLVYTASGSVMKIYSFPEGLLAGTRDMNEPIADILMLYNK